MATIEQIFAAYKQRIMQLEQNTEAFRQAFLALDQEHALLKQRLEKLTATVERLITQPEFGEGHKSIEPADSFDPNRAIDGESFGQTQPVDAEDFGQG